MSYLTCRVSSTFYFLLVLCLTSVSVHAKPSVSWSEQSLNVEVLNGTVVVKELSFVTTDAIKDLSFKIGDDCDDLDDDYCAGQPNLASFIEVVQPLPGPIVAGASISIGIVFRIPSDIPEGAYSGTLHVRDGKKTKARPLEFSLFVTHGSSDIVPEGISIATPTGSQLIQLTANCLPLTKLKLSCVMRQIFMHLRHAFQHLVAFFPAEYRSSLFTRCVFRASNRRRCSTTS